MSTDHIDDAALTSLLDASAPDGASERRARAHIASCTSCRARYDENVRLRRALAGASIMRVEDDGVVRRVLAQTHPSPPVQARAQGKRDRSRAFVFAGVAAAACIALFVVVARLNDPVLAATVLHARGATLDGAPLVKGAALHEGAALEVAGAGLVELDLVRGGTLRVFPDASLSLDARGEAVHLTRGKVWAIVEASRGPFVVHTDGGSARVLGTSFLVESRAAETDVKVVKGRVEVRGTSSREPVVVSGGERTRVARGGQVEPPRRYDAHDDSNQWQRFFDDLLKGLQHMADDVIRGVNDALDPSRKR